MNINVLGRILQMLGFCDSEHDPLINSRGNIKFGKDRQVGEGRTLRIGQINRSQGKTFMDYGHDDRFKLLRSELMMNVIPTKVSANSDEIQSAMLHHVMRRLTEPTLLQREGK